MHLEGVSKEREERLRIPVCARMYKLDSHHVCVFVSETWLGREIGAI